MNQIKKEVKRIRILHFALVLSLSAFIAVSYLFASKKGHNVEAHLNIEIEIALTFLIVAICLIGYLIFNKKHKNSLDEDDLTMRVKELRTALIIYYACIEASILICLIIYLVFGILNFILFAMLLVVFMIYLRPHDQKLIELLDLDEDQTNLLR